MAPMAPNNTSRSNPVVSKFSKSAHSPSTRAQSALKFSSMHSNGGNRQERNPHLQQQKSPQISPAANSKSSSHFVVQMGTSIDQRTIPIKQKPTPWYKSSIIKLIGKPIISFLSTSIVVIRGDTYLQVLFWLELSALA